MWNTFSSNTNTKTNFQIFKFFTKQSLINILTTLQINHSFDYKSNIIIKNINQNLFEKKTEIKYF